MLGDVCGWLVLNSMLSDRLQFNVLQTQSLTYSACFLVDGFRGKGSRMFGVRRRARAKPSTSDPEVRLTPLSVWKPFPFVCHPRATAAASATATTASAAAPTPAVLVTTTASKRSSENENYNSPDGGETNTKDDDDNNY